jgi:translation initiation factor 1
MRLEDWRSSRLVYSTDSAHSQPKPAGGPEPTPPERQTVRVKLDRKGRRGKCVTVVEGLVADAATLDALARRLKAACGSGGTAKQGRIEIQGEHRDKVLLLLAELGYRPKPSGG